MNSRCKNDTSDISVGCQDRKDIVSESDESKNLDDSKTTNVTEMSSKQLQIITFLSKTETDLEKFLKEERFSDCIEVQNVIKNLAIILKTGDKETKQCALETLDKDDNNLLFLLEKLTISLFKGRAYV